MFPRRSPKIRCERCALPASLRAMQDWASAVADETLELDAPAQSSPANCKR